MSTITDREKWDIQKIEGNRDYYPSLPEHRKTAAVSMAAVSACGNSLEYVPDGIISKEICRAALKSRDVDCSILPYIPFPDVQMEGIQRFSDTPAFVLYSFADITNATMAKEAVKADAYCLQLVPDKLVTKDLCQMALQSPNADEKILKFVSERFPSIQAEERTHHNTNRKLKM